MYINEINNENGPTILFGPILSRRLGWSLGVDLVPHKQCTFNCIYCECGRTTRLSLERQEFYPLKKVIGEVDSYLQETQKRGSLFPLLPSSLPPALEKKILEVRSPHYLTFSGSGEPTLYSRLGEIVNHIREKFPSQAMALLTNGSLLWDSSLIKELQGIDLIIPSLNAVSASLFKKINRPHANLSAEKIINGIIDFSHSYSGRLWIEIFIVPGINDEEAELSLLKSVLKKIKLEKIQLNSLDRPGSESWINIPSAEKLQSIANFFRPLPVEIISKAKLGKVGGVETTSIDTILIGSGSVEKEVSGSIWPRSSKGKKDPKSNKNKNEEGSGGGSS